MRWKLFGLSALLLSVTNGQLLTIKTGNVYQGPLNSTTQPDVLLRDASADIQSSQNIGDSTEEQPNSAERSSNETNINREDQSHEIPEGEENHSNVPPMSEEDASVHKPSVEIGSNEKPGSGEKLSGENTESQEKSEDSFAVSRSGEPTNSNEESSVVINDKKMVQTTHGPVIGKTWQDNSDILGFIDIPYGTVTTPFEAPATAQSWLDPHDITQHTKRCPQMHNDEYIGDMNCLTLSIFTTIDKENASVLFYIHDDYSNSGSGDPAIYGPQYLVPNGIILVLPNYRFGPMGFLSLQNDTAPGNAGLKDLSLALEWLKENIHLFGGNPENIVVSGDGAAGAYASYLALCSRSKYYIDKVITESGTALSHWALDRDPISTAYALAQKIRNDNPDGNNLNNTFEEASLERIVKAAKDMRFNPCLEQDKEPFMDGTPWEMLHGRDIDTTFMIGSAKYAGTHEAMATTENYTTQLNNDFGQILPDDLIFTDDDERQEFAQKLKTQYFGVENISLDLVEELSLWYTDASYLSPAIRLARPLLTAGATVYFYEFAFVGNLNRELESMNKPVQGAVRSDIVGYLFHKDGTDVAADTPEKHMIDLMVDLWVSFINYGKPATGHVQWNELKQVDASEEEWLLIDSVPRLEKGLHVKRLQLWTELYNEHFIEANSGLRPKPHYYVSFMASLTCWIAKAKLNYNSG